MLGVAALFWWRVAFTGDTVVTSILVAPLIALFGWKLKQHLETKIALDAEQIVYQKGRIKDAEQIVYQKGRIKKAAQYIDIKEIWFREVNGFDAASTCWVFLLLFYPMQHRDEDSFHNFIQWLGVTEPEKTLTLDLSLFDKETSAELLSLLAAATPQATYDQAASALIVLQFE